MKTNGGWWSGLRVRVLMLLSLALLPIGLIAVYQTSQVDAAAEENAQLALLALTRQAAFEERTAIERALGASQALSTTAITLMQDNDACIERFSTFLQKQDNYSFAGILPVSGLMTCSSTGEPYDFSAFESFQKIIADGETSVTVNRNGPLSRTSVVVVSEPIYDGEQLLGFVALSIPHAAIEPTSLLVDGPELRELMTMNSSGDILTARVSIDTARAELPADMDLLETMHQDAYTFLADNGDGVPRRYTVANVRGAPISIIGVWDAPASLVILGRTLASPSLFPLLMWAASLFVAMFALHGLVLRHVGNLRRQIRKFETHRTVPARDDAKGMPKELGEVYHSFTDLADSILQDEARMEDILRDKNVLMKEVHHRVKNNLQMISSIMNLQIRNAESDETVEALRRLQQRVLSMATIHRDLYQSQNKGRVNAGHLLSDIAAKSVESAVSSTSDIDFISEFDPVALFPDQAVPLSLFVSEAITNALKHMGVTGDSQPWLHATLKQTGKQCVLTIANSVGTELMEVESTGMGAQLMRGFAIQLGGPIEIEQTAEKYEMVLRFDIQDFTEDSVDY